MVSVAAVGHSEHTETGRMTGVEAQQRNEVMTLHGSDYGVCNSPCNHCVKIAKRRAW